MVKFGAGGKLMAVLLGLAILGYASDRYLGRRRVLHRLGLVKDPPVALSTADFPPGAAAPVGDLVAVPPRPLRLATLPRGASAALLMTAGGPGLHRDSPSARAFGLEIELSLPADEAALAEALAKGGDRGGIDGAVLSVDRLAQLRKMLPEARLRSVLLLSRSRGHDALASAPSIEQIGALKGKKVAVCTGTPARYLLYWALSQANLTTADVELVQATSSADAARLFQEGRVEAAAALQSDLAGPVKERAGRLLSSTADAPHLIADLLVLRSDLIARYPDAARRAVRSLLESAESLRAEPTEGARLLAQFVPSLGDPFEALKTAPPALLTENLAFFGLRGDAPVRYDELFASAASLWKKLGEPSEAGQPADTRDLGPLLAASAAAPTGTLLGTASGAGPGRAGGMKAPE